jgi:hypothetical protein
MITFRVSAEVNEDRQVTLTLPAEVPVGKTELVISISPQDAEKGKPYRSSLADWADTHAESWGTRLRSVDVEGFTGRQS